MIVTNDIISACTYILYPFNLAMVYLGFGIIAASLSFLFYKHGFPTPSRLVEVWRRLNPRNSASATPISPIAAADESGGDKGTEKDILRESDEGFDGDERSDVAIITTTTTAQPRAREDEEESFTIHNTTGPAIPTFTLTNDDDGANSRQEDHDDITPVQSPKLKPAVLPPLPQFSTQSSSHPLMTPTLSPRPQGSWKQKPFSTISNYKNSTSIMPPPPPRPTTAMRPPPKPPSLTTPLSPPPSTASTLRVPSLTTRSLPHSLGGSTLSASTLPLPQRSSRKVLLAAGHSPLDWANLLRKPPSPSYFRGPNLPPHLIRVPPSLLRTHNGRKGNDAWGVFQGKVYNLTPYLNFHPGGVGELLRGAGKAEEGEKLFKEIHPWVSWESILGECLIGILVSESEVIRGAEEASLDGMD